MQKNQRWWSSGKTQEERENWSSTGREQGWKKHQGAYVPKCTTAEVNGSMVKHVKGRKNKANEILK